MASPSMEAPHPTPTTIRDLIGHGDYDDEDFIAQEEEEDEDEWDDNVTRRLSRLSMEGSDGGDADDENDGGGDVGDEEDDGVFDEVRSDVNGATPYRLPAVPPSASLPGTPDRAAQASSPLWPGPSGKKEYASETEARWPPGSGGGRRRQQQHRRERVMREVWLERAWRMRKQRRQMLAQGQAGDVPVVVVVLGGGGEASSPSRGGVAMDMEEVRACLDLGLDLPGDWTVENPCYALSGVDTASSGGNSPAGSGSWRISSPGDDPKDVKARLKVWAQAAALASVSRLGS